MELTLRQKKLLTWVGYPLLALFTFVIALHVTFPYHRVKGKVIEALSDKYDVAIAEVEPTFLPGGVIFTKIVLQTRPDDPNDKPKTIIIDKLRVDAGLIAMLRGRMDIDILAEIGAGKIKGNIVSMSSGTKTRLSSEDLDVSTVPWFAAAVGLPMSGRVDFDAKLDMPRNKFGKMNGRIELSVSGGTVGDGKTKIKPRKRKKKSKNGRFRRRRRGFMDPTKGITVPRLSLGDTSAVIVIKNGTGVIEKFSGKSKDGEMKIEGDIKFADPFKRSKLPGCFHFKLSKSLKKREKNFGQIMDFLDVSADKDGWGHMKLVGNLADLSFRPVKACKPGVRDKRRRTKRPRVTTRRRPTRRPAGANARNKARNLKKNLKKTKGTVKRPPGMKGINKNRLKGVRGKSGPNLRKKLRGAGRKKRGDDVKKGITVDEKGRPSDSARPGDDDDDDDKKRGDDDDDDDDDDDKSSNNNNNNRRDSDSGDVD